MPLGDAEGAGLDEGGGGLEFLLEILARQALGLADVDLVLVLVRRGGVNWFDSSQYELKVLRPPRCGCGAAAPADAPADGVAVAAAADDDLVWYGA